MKLGDRGGDCRAGIQRKPYTEAVGEILQIVVLTVATLTSQKMSSGTQGIINFGNY